MREEENNGGGRKHRNSIDSTAQHNTTRHNRVTRTKNATHSTPPHPTHSTNTHTTQHTPVLGESLQGLRERGAQVANHVLIDLVVDAVVYHVPLRALLVYDSGVRVRFLQQLHNSYSRVLSWRTE